MRYSNETNIKTNGIVYTPRGLAEYLVANMLNYASLLGKTKLRILDPAIGDGELVIALINEIKRNSIHLDISVLGFETDANAVSMTIGRLYCEYPDVSVDIRNEDFLSYASGYCEKHCFDFIITNSEMARTKVLLCIIFSFYFVLPLSHLIPPTLFWTRRIE
jgi:type I restriction-modification system DNA methylase subunit